jgi:hypothetical protein
LIAAGITILMQIIIIATSNHNFVNFLVIALCLFLLDDRFVGRFIPARVQKRIMQDVKPASLLSKILVSSVAVLIVTSSITAFYWRLTRNDIPDILTTPAITAQQYGLGHIFHIFPTMQVERQELEIQGSYDGSNWYSYIFKYKPGPLDRAPRFNVPHQPRLDWMMWFIPPQSAMDDYWFQRLLERLRQGSPQVLALLEHNPFPGRPPRYLRVLAYQYHFTTAMEREKTGNWWKREYLGVFPHVRPRRP